MPLQRKAITFANPAQTQLHLIVISTLQIRRFDVCACGGNGLYLTRELTFTGLFFPPRR